MHYKLYAMMEVFFHLDRFFGGVSCNARIYHAENHCEMGKYEESGEKSDANGFFAFAVFGMLVVYCLKDVEWMRGTHGIPELIGIGVTALIQIGSRQMILSTAGGTLFYMLLIHSLQ